MSLNIIKQMGKIFLLVIILLCQVAPVSAKEVTVQTGSQKIDNGAQPIVLGNRIPAKYFVTAGSGQTDIGPGQDPWETGSYDLALLQANIANFNVVPYTSVLPPESSEIPLDEAKKYFHHGAVVEVIMADQNGVKGDTLTTGVGRIYVRTKKG